eukprot:Hpha_TRINITY_DN2767_c0_g1::TRINITY_DN2767_c0_g1_i1::g.110519::m.110519
MSRAGSVFQNSVPASKRRTSNVSAAKSHVSNISMAKSAAGGKSSIKRKHLDPAQLAASDRARGDSRSEILAWEENKVWSLDWHPWELYSIYRFFTRNIERLAGPALELHEVKEFAKSCPCCFHGDAWKTWFRDPMVLELTVDGKKLRDKMRKERRSDIVPVLQQASLRIKKPGWLDYYGITDGWEIIALNQSDEDWLEDQDGGAGPCGGGTMPTAPADTGQLRSDDDDEDGWRGWPKPLVRLSSNADPDDDGDICEKNVTEVLKGISTRLTPLEKVDDEESEKLLFQLLLRPPDSETVKIDRDILNREKKWKREEGDPSKKSLRWTVHPDGDLSHDQEEEQWKPVEDGKENDAPHVRLFSSKAGYKGFHSDGEKRDSVILGGPPTRQSRQGEDTWAKGCPICTYIFEPQAHYDSRTRLTSRVPGASVVTETWHWPRRKVARLFKALMKKVQVARGGRVGKGDHAMTPFEFCKGIFQLMGEARDVGGVSVRTGVLLQAHLVFKAFDFDRGGCLDEEEVKTVLGAVGGLDSEAAQEDARGVFDKFEEDKDNLTFVSEKDSITSRPWMSKMTLAHVLNKVAYNPKDEFASLVLNLAHVTTYRLMRPENIFAKFLGELPCCGGWDPPVNPLNYPAGSKVPESDPVSGCAHWACCVKGIEPFTDEVPGSVKGPPTAQELYALYVAFTVKGDSDDMSKDEFLDLLKKGIGSNDRGEVIVDAKDWPGFLLTESEARELGFTNELKVISTNMMQINLRDVWLSRRPKKAYCGYRRKKVPKVQVFEGEEGEPVAYDLFNKDNYPHSPDGKPPLADEPPDERCPAIEKLHWDEPTKPLYNEDYDAIERATFTGGLTVRHSRIVRKFERSYLQLCIFKQEGEIPELLMVGPGASRELRPSSGYIRRTLVTRAREVPAGLRPKPWDDLRGKNVKEHIEKMYEDGENDMQVEVELEFEESLLRCTRCDSRDIFVEMRCEKLRSLKSNVAFSIEDSFQLLGLNWLHTDEDGLRVAPDTPMPKGAAPFAAQEFFLVDMSDTGEPVQVGRQIDLSGRQLRALWLKRTAKVQAETPDDILYYDHDMIMIGSREECRNLGHESNHEPITNGEDLLKLLRRIASRQDKEFGGDRAVHSIAWCFGPQRVQHACGTVKDLVRGLSYFEEQKPELLQRLAQAKAGPQTTIGEAKADIIGEFEDKAKKEGFEPIEVVERYHGPYYAFQDADKNNLNTHDVLCHACLTNTLDDERVIDRSKADALFNKLDRESGNGDGYLSKAELQYGVLEALGKMDKAGSAREALQAKQLFVWVFFAGVDESGDGKLEERELRDQLAEIIKSYTYREDSERDKEAAEKVEEFFKDLNLAWEQPEAVATREAWDEDRRRACKKNLRDRMVDKELLTMLLTYKEPGMNVPKWDFLIPYFTHDVTTGKVMQKNLCYFQECTWCHTCCDEAVMCEWRESCDDGRCSVFDYCIIDCCRKVDLEVDDMPKIHCSHVFSNPRMVCC